MQNKNNLDDVGVFEVMEMDVLLNIQGGGPNSIFDSIKCAVLDLFGINDATDKSNLAK